MSTPGPDETLCPFCAEVIKKAAIKCRWCGSDLSADPGQRSAEPVGPAPSAPDGPDDAATHAPQVVTPSAPEPVDDARGRPASTPRVLAAVLAVLVLLAGAGLGLVVHRASGDTVAPDGQLTSEGARRAIMQEAAALVTKAMSYRAAESASDIKAAEKVMTPRMRKEYEKTLPATDQRGAQAELGMAVDGSVASMTGAKGTCKPADCAVGLLSATRDTAELLVFADQDVTVKSGKNTVVSQTWQRVRIVKQHGVWLIDDMQAS